MTYFNLCGINSKHSNISKGENGGGDILKIIAKLNYMSHAMMTPSAFLLRHFSLI
jgi:hypothetical protein